MSWCPDSSVQASTTLPIFEFNKGGHLRQFVTSGQRASSYQYCIPCCYVMFIHPSKVRQMLDGLTYLKLVFIACKLCFRNQCSTNL